MKQTFLLTIVFTLICAISLQAHVPKGGLGDAAVSPDGKIIVVGGDNRVLYIMDAASLTVKERIWFKSNIYEMEFNKDGSILVVEDTSETLYFVNTKDWQTVKKVPKAGYMSPAPAADILAGADPGYKTSKVKFISMTDGSLKGQVEFPAKVIGIGLDASGKRLVLMAQGPKDKEAKQKKPKELKGLEADIFKQKNDGKVSILAEFDVPSGKKISEKTVFYSVSAPKILVAKKVTYIFTYQDINAKIVGDDITLFKGQSSYNYGIGISPDREAVLLGGLRKGTRIKAADLGMVTFDVDSLPGWPEYYKGFGFASDGTGYAVTTAYRLVKINKNGTMEKAIPVY
jgi:glutamine cyclotransferase